jgi:hypothetical protein
MNLRKISSSVMICVFILISFRHVWTVFFNLGPEALNFITSANMSLDAVKIIVCAGVIFSLMLLHSKTFVAGNLGNALITFYIGYMLYSSGRTSEALVEIPFTASYLFLIYLGHPAAQKIRKMRAGLQQENGAPR